MPTDFKHKTAQKRDGWAVILTILVMVSITRSRARQALGAALLIASFALVAFDAWERESQDDSAREAQRALESSLNLADGGRTVAPEHEEQEPPVPQPAPAYQEGEAVGLIKSAGGEINAVFVMGTSEDSLAKGPGMFRTSAMPGTVGNTAIAGHRTSHGAPFINIDKLTRGEEIRLETEYGIFKYRVTGVEIVGPRDVRVLSDKNGADLTLIACHPLHSTKQRIVVTAEMRG